MLTGDSFFHLAGFGESLPGLNLCGAGRVVCLIDPVGDVYACPFAIHDNFLAGNVRSPGGFQRVWQHSELFAELRSPQTGGACTSCSAYDACRGGCMAAKFFTGLPLDGPDPECVKGNAETRAAQHRSPARAEAVAGPLTPHPSRPRPRRSRSRSRSARDRSPGSSRTRRAMRTRWPVSVSPVPVESVGRSFRFADLTWPEVRARVGTVEGGAVLAVPIGSTEQHGPHLPFSTDTDIAVALCERLAEANSRVSLRRRSRTAPVANTLVFPAHSPSVRPPWSCW